MRKIFTQTVTDKRVTITNGTFDNTGIEDKWADLVVIAQAFHWCPNHETAVIEFNRILKPSGTVVFIWNVEDKSGARWVAQLRDCIEEHESGTPQFRLNLWRQVFETHAYRRLFRPPIEKSWKYALNTTADKAVDRALSKSYIAALPEDEKIVVERELRRITGKAEDRVWIDEEKGIFEYPYQVLLVVAGKQ